MFLGFAGTLVASTCAYLFVSWIIAVILYSQWFSSSTLITLYVWNSTSVFSIAHTLFACGFNSAVDVKGDVTVIVLPEILLISLVSIIVFCFVLASISFMLESTTESFALLLSAKSVLFASSTIIWSIFPSPWLSLTEFIRPPLLIPAFKLSAIPIIVDGLIYTPASNVAVKLQIWVSFKFVYKNHLPKRFAWPLEVQAKVLSVFLIFPNFVV